MRRQSWLHRLASVVLIVVGLIAIAVLPTDTLTPSGTTPTATAGDPASTSAVLVGAGDIARCSTTGDEETAALLEGIEGTVFTTGDNAYSDGTTDDFASCYEPSWGRLMARTRPSPGNHDYHTPGGDGYYGYFGATAGPAGLGYYAYDLGDWRIYALNSNCDDPAVDCNAQLAWLQNDLASEPRACVAAYWHHPRFSSGRHGGHSYVQPLWETLHAAGAELILNGHDHDYERFAPMDPRGALDVDYGLREFVVGTGGAGLRDFLATEANSEVRSSDTHGVLRLDLRSDGYAWSFIPVSGTFSDTGSGACHGSPAASTP
ncbi:MAG: metallophosphoesterase [Candidatus Limnocylindria bacterium]